MDFEKSINNSIEILFRIIFLSFWYGLQRLFSKINIIIFSIILIIALFLIQFLASYYIKILILLSPLIFIFFIGLLRYLVVEKYKNMFSYIGFRDKNKKYPIFIKKIKEKKDNREIIKFKSNLTLEHWEANTKNLEVMLNTEIMEIIQAKNKKIVSIILLRNFYLPKSVMWDDSLLSDKEDEYVVGVATIGKIKFNINKNPHLLIAGTTGSGKSVTLTCILWQAILKKCVVYMIDFKGGVMFGKVYEQFGQVLTERSEVINLLEKLVAENKKRLEIFREDESENLGEYNHKNASKKMDRICIFCDEVAEMLDTKGVSKEEKAEMDVIKGLLSTLARLSRATGINLFLGTQRPDANIISGQIKNNLDIRLCGRFADVAPSLIVLGNTKAKNLENYAGRFLYQLGNKCYKYQAYYFDKNMIKRADNTGSIEKDGIISKTKKADIADNTVRDSVNNKIKISLNNFDNFNFDE